MEVTRPIEYKTVPPENLKAAVRNANHMPAEQYEKLRAGIRNEGFLQPVLARYIANKELEIIDGHHRAQAATEVGLAQIPVWVVKADDQEAALLALQLNRLRGDINLSEVASIFADLVENGVDPLLLEATGFSSKEVDALISAATAESEEIPLTVSHGNITDDVVQEIKPWMLSIEFINKEEFDRAKKGLKRAAGKGELSAGLLRLLGEEV